MLWILKRGADIAILQISVFRLVFHACPVIVSEVLGDCEGLLFEVEVAEIWI